MRNKIIGISGVARSGKDTLCQLIGEHLPIKRFALADNLKKELNPFFKEQYSVDIFNCDVKTKEDLRPILVAHGKMRRLTSQGKHWTNMLKNEIDDFRNKNPNIIPVITDIRYDFYPEDEVHWIKNVMGGVLIHVQRYEGADEIGMRKTIIQPPNADERENDPKLKKAANYRIEWPTIVKEDGNYNIKELNIYVEEFIKWYLR